MGKLGAIILLLFSSSLAIGDFRPPKINLPKIEVPINIGIGGHSSDSSIHNQPLGSGGTAQYRVIDDVRAYRNRSGSCAYSDWASSDLALANAQIGERVGLRFSLGWVDSIIIKAPNSEQDRNDETKITIKRIVIETPNGDHDEIRLGSLNPTLAKKSGLLVSFLDHNGNRISKNIAKLAVFTDQVLAPSNLARISLCTGQASGMPPGPVTHEPPQIPPVVPPTNRFELQAFSTPDCSFLDANSVKFIDFTGDANKDIRYTCLQLQNDFILNSFKVNDVCVTVPQGPNLVNLCSNLANPAFSRAALEPTFQLQKKRELTLFSDSTSEVNPRPLVAITFFENETIDTFQCQTLARQLSLDSQYVLGLKINDFINPAAGHSVDIEPLQTSDTKSVATLCDSIRKNIKVPPAPKKEMLRFYDETNPRGLENGTIMFTAIKSGVPSLDANKCAELTASFQSRGKTVFALRNAETRIRIVPIKSSSPQEFQNLCQRAMRNELIPSRSDLLKRGIVCMDSYQVSGQVETTGDPEIDEVLCSDFVHNAVGETDKILSLNKQWRYFESKSVYWPLTPWRNENDAAIIKRYCLSSKE